MWNPSLIEKRAHPQRFFLIAGPCVIESPEIVFEVACKMKEIYNLSKNLSSIIKFIEKLNELNTDKTVPLTSIIEASLRLRKDEPKNEKIRDQILKNSPEKNEEFFVVPKVIE